MGNDQYRNEGVDEACARGIRWLSRSQRTIFEMRQYLYRKGYDEQVINDAISVLISEKLLNDEMYVREWLEVVAPSRGYGRQKIFAMLAKRGLDFDLIEDGYRLYFKDKERDVMEEVARKKLPTISGTDFEKSQKLGRFLISRGFSNGDVISYVERFLQ